MDKNLLIFEDPDDLVNRFVELWKEIAGAALREKDEFTAALSGGKTPDPFYRGLAEAVDLPWRRTHLFLADERFVPPDHPDSNYRLIRVSLINRIAIPPGNVHPVDTGRGSPEEAALRYGDEIGRTLHLSGNAWPVFDLIVLGIGEDGHTASLFPGHPVLQEKNEITAAVFLEKSGRHDRITLTLPVFNHAKTIIFLLTGREKASILGQILDGENKSLPAAMVKPESGSIYFLVDAAAGSEVRKSNPGTTI